MKVLLVSPLPPPVGGIATWTKNLIEYFESDPSQHVELSHVDTSIGNFSITNSNRVVRVFRGFWVTFKIYISFLKRLICDKPEVIHLTSSGSLALFKDLVILITSKLFDTRTVIHFRFGRIPDLLLTESIESRLLKLVVNISDIVILLDQKSHLSLKSKGIENSLVIGNPIPADFQRYVLRAKEEGANFPRSKESYQLSEGSLKQHVVFVGHVKPAKGVFELVKSMKDTCVKYQLDLIGPYEDETKEHLQKLGNELNVSIVFHGARERNYIFDAVRSSSVLALPSYTEGFPNVVLESLAVGCPVVSTTVGAIPDIVSETRKTGLLVEPRDIDGLRDALTRFLSDEELRKEYAKAGQEYVFKHYSTKVIYKQYVEVWNQLTKV